MCDDNGKSLITTLQNVILVPDLCYKLLLIITLTNSGDTCLFNKWFCTVYLGSKQKNTVTLPHSAQRKHSFLGKIMDMSKKKNYQQERKLL